MLLIGLIIILNNNLFKILFMFYLNIILFNLLDFI